MKRHDIDGFSRRRCPPDLATHVVAWAISLATIAAIIATAIR